jgi:DNA-binding CsgD family transcriptional regulator
VWGAFALHDAVRFDRAELVTDDLAALRAPGRGPIVDLLSDHAMAAATGTTVALEEVRNRFSAMGATAVVAECFAQAARRSHGTERARSIHLALSFGRRCPGLQSPLLIELEPPLSDRQHEVAMLAADDLSSREIAERLHVATRTVDNHLRSAYGAFGIHGRDELADLFPG